MSVRLVDQEAVTRLDESFIASVERDHFRTNDDTGANSNALLIWNRVRKHVGLPPLNRDDLPAFCITHNCYHRIIGEYGCAREVPGQAYPGQAP